jgi:hypothetical protein
MKISSAGSTIKWGALGAGAFIATKAIVKKVRDAKKVAEDKRKAKAKKLTKKKETKAENVNEQVVVVEEKEEKEVSETNDEDVTV